MPLYEWILKYGFEGIQMTFLEKVGSYARDACEIYRMHHFGVSNVLNRNVPNQNEPRWD